MHRSCRSLLVAALLAAIGVTQAFAVTPDDAIDLSQQGVADDTIIAKICADGEAWDLSADDIAYLREQGVSEDVIDALIDPEKAADEFGFTLGDGGRAYDESPRTAYVYSLGYYYGPLSRYYFCDPFFYSYYSCDDFLFSYRSWPRYYSLYCYPYSYGYYPYPYFAYPSTSFYFGGSYCGPSYTAYYRSRLRGGGRSYGNVRYRDWGNGGGRIAARSGKPDEPGGRWRNGADRRGDRGLALREPLRWERRSAERTRLRDPGEGSVARGVRARLRTGDPALSRGWRADQNQNDARRVDPRDEMRLRRPPSSYERAPERARVWRGGEGRQVDPGAGRVERGRAWNRGGASPGAPAWERAPRVERRERPEGDGWRAPEARRFDPGERRQQRVERNERPERGNPGVRFGAPPGGNERAPRGERPERSERDHGSRRNR